MEAAHRLSMFKNTIAAKIAALHQDNASAERPNAGCKSPVFLLGMKFAVMKENISDQHANFDLIRPNRLTVQQIFPRLALTKFIKHNAKKNC